MSGRTGGTARSVTRSETPISHRVAYLRRVVVRGGPASAVTSGASSGHRDSASRDGLRAVEAAATRSGPLLDGRRGLAAARLPWLPTDGGGQPNGSAARSTRDGHLGRPRGAGGLSRAGRA